MSVNTCPICDGIAIDGHCKYCGANQVNVNGGVFCYSPAAILMGVAKNVKKIYGVHRELTTKQFLEMLYRKVA